MTSVTCRGEGEGKSTALVARGAQGIDDRREADRTAPTLHKNPGAALRFCLGVLGDDLHGAFDVSALQHAAEGFRLFEAISAKSQAMTGL